MKLGYWNRSDSDSFTTHVEHLTKMTFDECDNKKLYIISDFDSDMTAAILKCYVDKIMVPSEIYEETIKNGTNVI